MLQVPTVPALSKKNIQQKADSRLRESCPDAWNGKEPVPLEAIFECDIPNTYGIDTGYENLSLVCGVEAYGYTSLTQKFSYVDISLTKNNSVAGRRFLRSTIGHELGHCFLHVPLDRWRESLHVLGVGVLREQKGLRPYENPEWQAWEMCKNLCMPEHLVQRFLKKYPQQEDAIEAMIEHFDMSYSFVTRRIQPYIKNNPYTVGAVKGQKYAKNPKRFG